MGEPTIIGTGKDGTLTGNPASVDALFQKLANEDKIVLHFHGGLIDDAAGRKIAQNLDGEYRKAGAHPVFFVWQSGLIEVLTHNLGEIAGEDFFKILLKYVTKYAVGKIIGAALGAKGVAVQPLSDMDFYQEMVRLDAHEEPFVDRAIPADDVEELSDEEQQDFARALEDDRDFQETVQAIVAAEVPPKAIAGTKGIDMRVRSSMRTLMSPNVVAQARADVEAAPPGSRGILSTAGLVVNGVRVLARVVSRFRKGRDHGVYPTIVEEILREFYLANVGVKIWGAMKKETIDTFVDADPIRGGYYFAKKLHELVLSGKEPKITLVGHSTGAVFINNMLTHFVRLREASSQPLPRAFAFENVVFLAPACTFDDFAERVVEPYYSVAEPLYRNLRIYTMNDDSECQDQLVPFVYTRSLLYFISGVLEPDAKGASAPDVPVVGMERYYKKKDVYKERTIQTVRNFVAADAKRAVWSPTKGQAGGLNSDARRHTAFDDEPITLTSLVHLIEKGY
jgi:hypothetical protein